MNYFYIMTCRVISCYVLLFFSSQEISATIRILTFHCNHAEFLEYQCKALERFLTDEYELVVMNDGVNEKEQKVIQMVCEKYGVKNVRYEQSWHTNEPLNEQVQAALSTPMGNDFFRFPQKDGCVDIQAIYENVSIRHCHLIQYALDHFGYAHDDIVVIMDGDVFPIQPISIRALLAEMSIVGMDSEFREEHYLWVPFIAFDPKQLPNLHDLRFHVDLIHDVVCDTGSHSYHYLKNNQDVKHRLYPRRTALDFFPYDKATFAKFGLQSLANSSINWKVRMEFYVDYQFVHFCDGSGLHPEEKFLTISNLMGLILEETLPTIVE